VVKHEFSNIIADFRTLVHVSHHFKDADIKTRSWPIYHRWRRRMASMWSLFLVGVYMFIDCSLECVFSLFC